MIAMARPFVALATLAAFLPAAAWAEGPIVPRFLDETTIAGVDSVYDGDWEFMVGGGATSFDCDDDGRPDLLLAGGARPAGLWHNTATPGGPLAFSKAESGLELDAVTGGYAFDADGDGKTDVLLLRVGENVMMRGLGGCRFERANEAWGFDGGDAWSTAAAVSWERGAGWPTVAIGNYIDRDKGALPWGSCTDNWLHRPGPDGRGFAPPVTLKPSFCALSMLFTDWNRSGHPDLRVSNDREYYKGGQEQLWRMRSGDAPALYTDAEGWKSLRIWGMGIAGADIDFDGYPEYFLTSMADNKLQKLAAVPPDGPPRPTFADVAFQKGVTAHRPYTGGEIKPSTAWHAQFEDVNNDGLADLFVAKGNVAEMPDFAAKDPNNLLLQQADGTFREMGDAAGVASLSIGRGATLADFNLDGLVDLVVTNRWAPAEVYRNVTPDAGRWLQLRLLQDGPNRDAIGAWIEVRCEGTVIRREVTVGGGHAGGHLGWWHVGLGPLEETEVRVLWPDGVAGPWQRVGTNAFTVIERGTEPAVWTPG
jgi:hypothetical protein